MVRVATFGIFRKVLVSSKTVMLSSKQKRSKKFSILRVCGIINFSCPVASIFPQNQITSKKFGKSGFSISLFSQKITASKK